MATRRDRVTVDEQFDLRVLLADGFAARAVQCRAGDPFRRHYRWLVEQLHGDRPVTLQSHEIPSEYLPAGVGCAEAVVVGVDGRVVARDGAGL